MESSSSGGKAEDVPLLRRVREAAATGAKLTLYEAARDTSVSLALLFLLWAFDLIQMLDLALAPSARLPWAAQPVMSEGVFKVTLNVGIVPSFVGTAFPADAELAAVCGLLVTVLALFAWSVAAHAGAVSYKPAWRARLLRTLTFFVLQGLIVPCFSTLGAVFNCKGTWLPGGTLTVLPCWQGAHAAAVFAACILLPTTIAYLALVALTVIDRAPSKKNATAAPHGRAFAGLLVIKAALAVFAGVTAGDVDPWLYFIIMAVGGSAWLWLFYTLLPYHLQLLNWLQGGAAAVFLSACACGLLSLGINNPSSSVGAIAWLMLLPTSAYAGASLIIARWRSFGATAELASPYAVEIRARFLLAGSAAPVASTLNALHSRAPVAGRLSLAGGAYAQLTDDGSRVDTAEEDEEGAFGGIRGEGVAVSKTALALRVASPLEKCIAADAAARAANVRKASANANVSEAANAVDTLYANALAVFPASSLLDLFTAYHQAATKKNSHLARVYLRSAAAKADASSVDVRFFIWSSQHEAEEEVLATDAQQHGAGGGMKMTVQRRMHFEELLDDVRNKVTLSRSRILAFWGELCDRSPDLARVAAAGVAINASFAETRALFDALLELSPNSASVMREYADWLLEQANDPQRADELLTDAEQIEDEQSRAHQQTLDQDVTFFALLNDFDLSAENLAWIRVSALDGSTGIVTGSNTACLKMLGMQRRELIGKDVNTIVPDPIGHIHGQYLSRFKADGVEHVVNHSRVTFVLHRQGHLVPVRINTRPQESDWVAVLEEVSTSLAFVWATGPSQGQGWRVTAACPRGLAALSASAASVKAGNVTLHALFAEPAESCAALLDAPDGIVIQLGGTSVLARLQLAGLSFIPGAIYMLRWRPVSLARGGSAARRVTSSAADEGGGAVRSLDDDDDGGGGGGGGASDDGGDSMSAGRGSGSDEGGDALAALLHPPPQRSDGAPLLPGTAVSALELVPGELSNPAPGCPVSGAPAGGRGGAPLQSRRRLRLEGRGSSQQRISKNPQPPRDSRERQDPSRSSRELSRTGSKGANVASDGTVSDDEEGGAQKARGRSAKEGGAGVVKTHASNTSSSIHSGGSRGSSSTVALTIRRSVVMRASTLDQSLVTLRYTLVFLASLVCLMCVAQLVVAQTLFAQLTRNFNLVMLNTEAAVALQGAYSAAQRLEMITRGVVTSHDFGNISFVHLEDQIDKLEHAHLELYGSLDGVSAVQTALWTVASITVGELIPGSYHSRGNFSTVKRVVSLANVGVEFISKARQILALRNENTSMLTNIRMDNPDVFFVVENGWTTIRDAYNASILIAGDRSSSQGDTILSANIVILAVTLGLLTFIAVFLVAPAVNTVVASKNRIFNVFLAVPLAITRHLHSKVRIKIEALQRAAAEADVGMDVGGEGEAQLDDDYGGGDGGVGGSGGEASGSGAFDLNAALDALAAHDDSHAVDDKPQGCCARRRSSGSRRGNAVAPKTPRGGASKHAGKHERHFRSATRVQAALLFQLLWPLAAFAGYYVGTYWWLQQTVTVVNQAKEEVLWSSQVRFGSTVMAFNARNYLSLRGVDPDEVRFINVALDKCDNRADIVESALNDLLYGSTTRNTRAGLQVSAAAYQLFLQDGCVDNGGFWYSMESCEVSFMSGLVGQGLLSSNIVYLQLVRASIATRRADLDDAAKQEATNGGTIVELPYVDMNIAPQSELEDLGEKYLFYGFEVFEEYVIADALSIMSSFLSNLLLSTLLCILALALFATFIYMPTISRLDRDIKSVRYLLLLFPDNVSSRVPVILAVAHELSTTGQKS